MYTVYIHKNKINEKIYVGITKQKPEQRWRLNGRGYKTQEKFWNAIQKYGWDNFEHIIIAENLNGVDAGRLEQILIQQYDSIKNGYNVDLGGQITNHSLETALKIKNSMFGHYHTEATKQKISAHKQAAKKAVVCVETGMHYESLQSAFQHTGIDKSSISKVCMGIMHTAGGYHWYFEGEEPLITNNNNYTPVYCITTKHVYINLTEAARDTGCDASNILKVCNGKYKTTNHLQWKKITMDEYNQYQGGIEEEEAIKRKR